MRRYITIFGLMCLFGVRALGQIPDTAASDFERAVELFQKQQFPAALVLVQELREKHPDNFEITHLSAMLLDLNNQPQEANQEFARAVSLNPDSDRARTNLGVSALRLGRLEEAVEQFQAAYRLNPLNATAAFNLGAVHLRRQQLEEAVGWFQAAYDLQPNLYQNGYQLALVRFLLSEHEKAGQVLDQIRSRVPAGVIEFQLLDTLNRRALPGGDPHSESLDQLLQQVEGGPEVVSQVADLLLSQQLLPETERLLLQSVAGGGNFELWMKLAEVQFRLGKFESSLASVTTAGKFRQTAGQQLLLADLLESLDRPVEAVEHYRRAVEMEPSDQTYYALGYEFLSHWNWEEAEAVFEVAVKRFPDAWRLWLGLGTAAWGQGKSEAATREFLKAAEVGPGQPMIYQMLSLSFVQAEDSFQEAVEEFRDYQTTEPENPWALYYRALAEVELGKREGTPADVNRLVPWLEQAASAEETRAPAQFLLGELYFADRQWNQAIGAFETALSVDPNQIEARYKLGLALQRAGFHERALQELERYQQLKDTQENEVGERISQTKRFIIDMKKP